MPRANQHAELSGISGDESHKTWVAAGGILGAIAASSCCILPLVLFSLGISGLDPLLMSFFVGVAAIGAYVFMRRRKANRAFETPIKQAHQ